MAESAGGDDDGVGPDVLRVVVMGVAGSGKTTVGERLATRVGARFVDADGAHPPENVAKMAAGTPLTDDDRRPWLDRLAGQLAAHDRIVVTCSALKRRYRDVLRRVGGVRFVHLDIPPAVAVDRTDDRDDHFMKSDMIESQFEALEPPDADETDVVVVDATVAPDQVLATVVAAVRSGAAGSVGLPSPDDRPDERPDEGRAGERRDG